MLVRLLGGVEVAGADGQWRTVPGKRGCVLSVLAVAAGMAVRTDELVHRVWGDTATELADGAAYPHITRLRATLSASGATIGRASGGYVLDIDPDEVDLLAVRRLASRAREDTESGRYPRAVRAWRQAAALLRGEALAGVDGDWAKRVRQQFSAEAQSILAERFRLELRFGRHLAVLDELLAAQARYPVSEALAEPLMLALYRSDRQTEALEVFARTVSRLRDQMGIDPSTSLRRLQRQILNHDEEIAAPREVQLADGPPVVAQDGGFTPPAQLPAPARNFVGRKTAIEALRRAVDRSSVLVVDGMPGVGKTAIAVHIAAELAERFPDGQLFVELHGYSGDKAAVAPEEALGRMLRGLGATEDEVPSGLDERAAELRTRVAGRRVLLLLDNAFDAAQVRPLLPGGSDCLTIVTSRRRMPDLLDAVPLTLEIMESTEAVRLLVAAVDDPQRVSTDSAEAAELVEAAGRLPLAIRLLAARLRNRRHWTPGYLLGRLRDRPILDELAAQDAGVASAFTVSYSELDAEHQRMFRLLGLFPGRDFDAGFASALAEVAAEHADRSLEELVDAHLVQSTEPGRYRFHDLLRHFAATIAAETEAPAALETARRRLYDAAVLSLRHAIALYDNHRSFYPRLIDPADPPPFRWQTQSEAVAWLRTELINLRTMTRDALAHRMDRHCAEMAAALCSHLNHSGLDRDTEPVARWGLESALRIGDEECEGFLLNKHAAALAVLGDIDQAERQYRRALVIHRRLGNPRYIVSSLANLSHLYVSIGEWERTIDLRSEALGVAVSSGNTELEVILRSMLAYALCEVGRTAETRCQLELAEELLADSGDEDTRMQLVTLWGNLRRGEGEPAEAQLLHERALAHFRSMGEVMRTAIIQIEVAHDLIEQGGWEAARSVGIAAMEILSDYKDVIQRAEISLLLAEVCLDRGEYDDALEQLRTADDLAQGRKAAHLVADAKWGMARAGRALGDEDDAIRCAERALAYYSRFELPRTETVRRFLAEK